MPATHYDSIEYNADIILDLPFREGTGNITRDVAKPHHVLSLENTPTWTVLASGLNVIQFNGTNEYLNGLNADTVDLDFTASDYSLSGWVNYTDTSTSLMVMSRYFLDVSGWELYLFVNGVHNYLQLRHHHAGGATKRTGAFSDGWIPDTWHHFGISRSGGDMVHYRNGIPLTTSISTGGLIDPESSASDLTVGTRYTKNADWYKGYMWRPRVWNRALSEDEWKNMYNIEKRWFP